jgi:hypothetical protein
MLSKGLSRLGTAGGYAAVFGIAFDAMSGEIQSALYDSVDALTYTALAAAGAAGALESAGGSAALAGATMATYYAEGGSRGIVQQTLGCGN